MEHSPTPVHRVVVLGGGGHAHVVIEILQEMGDIELVGVLHAEANDVLGVPRLGSDDDLPMLAGHSITGAIAAVGDNQIRRTFFDRILASGLTPINAIHPSAVISRSTSLGRGLVIMPQAVINAMCRIGDNVIVNTAVTIDHHGSIGSHVHIAPGCHIAGGVTVDDLTLLGVGATVVPGVRIGARVFVGAGLTVTRDLPDDTRASRDPGSPW